MRYRTYDVSFLLRQVYRRGRLVVRGCGGLACARPGLFAAGATELILFAGGERVHDMHMPAAAGHCDAGSTCHGGQGALRAYVALYYDCFLPSFISTVLLSIVASIRRCHRRDPGSIPGGEAIIYSLFFPSVRTGLPLASPPSVLFCYSVGHRRGSGR
jgi:hypothetical protein